MFQDHLTNLEISTTTLFSFSKAAKLSQVVHLTVSDSIFDTRNPFLCSHQNKTFFLPSTTDKMIQRHQENDLYMTMMTTTTMAVPEDDGGSITSTMSTTTNTATTLSSSITSSSSSSKKKKKITKKTKKSSRSQSSKHHDNVTPTMIVTKPAQFDILCGKDKTYNKHAGNQVFRAMIETWVKAYQQATTKQEKMRITKQIVHSLQVQFESRFLKPAVTAAAAAASDASRLGGGGGGVEQWTEISNQVARDKVSHALRFAAKQQQTLVKTAMLQAKNLPKQKFSMSPSRPVAARPTTVAKKASQKPTVVGVDDDDEGVESLFQLQQAILLGSLNANNKNKNNNNSGIRQQPQHYAAEEQHADEPEFNTLRSEDLNALLDEPVMLENDYDTLMSLSK